MVKESDTEFSEPARGNGELTQGAGEDKDKHRWVFSEQGGVICEVADIFEEIKGEEMVKAGVEVQKCSR